PADETVGHRADRRAARPGAQCHMVETQLEGAIDRNSAAKTNAAIHRKARPALEQQPHNLQKILVPADGDPVLGDTAEPRHDAIVEPFDKGHDIADWLEPPAGAVPRHARELGGP